MRTNSLEKIPPYTSRTRRLCGDASPLETQIPKTIFEKTLNLTSMKKRCISNPGAYPSESFVSAFQRTICLSTMQRYGYFFSRLLQKMACSVYCSVPCRYCSAFCSGACFFALFKALISCLTTFFRLRISCGSSVSVNSQSGYVPHTLL